MPDAREGILYRLCEKASPPEDVSLWDCLWDDFLEILGATIQRPGRRDLGYAFGTKEDAAAYLAAHPHHELAPWDPGSVLLLDSAGVATLAALHVESTDA